MVEKAIKPEIEQTISKEGVFMCVLFCFHKCDIILDLLKCHMKQAVKLAH